VGLCPGRPPLLPGLLRTAAARLGFLDQALIAAVALLLGSLIAARREGRLIVGAGVLAGMGVCALTLLVRPLVGTAPEDWFHGRTLQGWIGYHNAQASFLGMGLALSLWALSSRRAAVRAPAGALAMVFASTTLVTQSRAGVGVGAMAAVVVLLWARSSALILRVLPIGVFTAALSLPLRDLDRELVDKTDAVESALETYATWSLLAAAAAAVLAVPSIRSTRVRRGIVAGLAAVAVVGLTVGAVVELRSDSPFGGAFSTFDQPDPNVATAGSTRLASLSLNGRRDAWRVAWDLGRETPLVGDGQGRYPLAWTQERRLETLYILQPHNVWLELFAELGVVGVALLATALALVVYAVLRCRDRAFAAAAIGILGALVVQASVDWTWSFPGLVAPALLVAGAAAGGTRHGPPGVVPIVGGSVVLLAVVGLLGAQGLGDREVDRARDRLVTDPAGSLAAADDARRWNRWDPAWLEIRGRLAERAGRLEQAADDYADAAKLSQRAWLDHFREARVAKAAGDGRRLAAACATAHRENPAETRLRFALC
jgi:O-antigen ligase